MRPRNLVTILVALVLTACGAHDDADHDHDHGHGRGGHAAAEPWAVTAWGDHFGLFPEVDALVAGEVADAHVHVTILEGFKPATEGTVAVLLTSAGGRQSRFSATTVARPGIFNVAIEAGSALGWERYVGLDGLVIGMKSFGASAPYKEVLAHFGFTVDAVVAAAKALM